MNIDEHNIDLFTCMCIGDFLFLMIFLKKIFCGTENYSLYYYKCNKFILCLCDWIYMGMY